MLQPKEDVEAGPSNCDKKVSQSYTFKKIPSQEKVEEEVETATCNDSQSSNNDSCKETGSSSSDERSDLFIYFISFYQN